MYKLIAALCLATAHARVRMEPDVNVFSAPSWTRGARVTADDSVTLQFFMKLSDARYHALDAKLVDVSTPSSARYGAFLDADAAAALVAAPPAAIDTVVEWDAEVMVGGAPMLMLIFMEAARPKSSIAGRQRELAELIGLR